MSPVIIILKIEVSARQPLVTPIFKPEKGPKSEENDPLLPEGWLRACENCRSIWPVECLQLAPPTTSADNAILKKKFQN